MNDNRRVYVTLEPRSATVRLFSAADLQAALRLVRERIPPSASRFAIRMDASTPEQDHDVVVCVPVTLFENRRAQAEEVVRRWDATWLLIESMSRHHRASASQHLVDEISMALLASAIEGVGEPADQVEDDDF
jgi:hypothetical protein